MISLASLCYFSLTYKRRERLQFLVCTVWISFLFGDGAKFQDPCVRNRQASENNFLRLDNCQFVLLSRGFFFWLRQNSRGNLELFVQRQNKWHHPRKKEYWKPGTATDTFERRKRRLTPPERIWQKGRHATRMQKLIPYFWNCLIILIYVRLTRSLREGVRGQTTTPRRGNTNESLVSKETRFGLLNPFENWVSRRELPSDRPRRRTLGQKKIAREIQV